jgi:hypothetical protein
MKSLYNYIDQGLFTNTLNYIETMTRLLIPEVNHLKYIVLWDDNTKQEVLTLSIDEDAILIRAGCLISYLFLYQALNKIV